MTETLSLLAMALLVAFVLVKAYASKILGQLRRECSGLVTEERHVRQEKEREETLLESAEARLVQLETDRDALDKELEQVTAKVEEAEGQLRRWKGEDDADGETPESDPALS